MRLLRFAGKLLISVGCGILLFVGWTLWGTGIYTQRQQDRLAAEFKTLPKLESRSNGLSGPPKRFDPGPGDPVFRLEIPAIDLSMMVVEGVGVDELKLGPGHYPQCDEEFSRPLCTELDEVWPGETGRVIVSGHRTTYLHPFFDLDRLSPGDRVDIETTWGDFTYVVYDTEIVEPDARDIANPAATDGRELVFTTCNPKYSADERLIVFAELEEAV
jgi:sortase A